MQSKLGAHGILNQDHLHVNNTIKPYKSDLCILA